MTAISRTEAGRLQKILRGLSFVMIAGTLGGCASMNPFGGGGQAAMSESINLASANSVPVTPPAERATRAQDVMTTGNIAPQRPKLNLPRTNIAMANMIGMPTADGQRLSRAMKSALGRYNVQVGQGAPEYTLRGYLDASPEGGGVRVAYVWDVLNKGRRRAHRIRGHEMIPGAGAGGSWSAINAAGMQRIANAAAEKFGTWVASKKGHGGAAVAAARQTRPSRSSLVKKAAYRPERQARPSVAKREVMAMVMPVGGAPGDGRNALRKAIQTSLRTHGVKLTSRNVPGTYQVRGTVKMGRPASGTQSVEILWAVYDPKGKRLGKVAQKNQVPAGSLNGKWGPIANAVASGAAGGVVKLLPKGAQS